LGALNRCGGSLVWNDIVLTAAHCLGAFQNWALVGAYKSASTDHGAELIMSNVEYRHPSYNSNSQTYDFMVVKLSQLATNHTTIKLNTRAAHPSGTVALRAIGMGVTSEKATVGSDVLRKVSVNHVPAAKCAKKYPAGWIVGATMMCASAPGKDSCYGTYSNLPQRMNGELTDSDPDNLLSFRRPFLLFR
jgi:secreted trypsin-like serine protease